MLAKICQPFGSDFDTMLLDHTMFPYLTIFTPPEKYERVYNWAKYSENGFDRFATGGIRRNVYPEKLMYCPECFKEDISLFGEAYWHRIHQTPGIVICRKHRCHLLSSSIPTFYQSHSSFQILQEDVMQESNTTIQKYRYDDFIHNDGIFDDTKFLYDNIMRVRNLFADYGFRFRDAFLPELNNKQLARKEYIKGNKFVEAFLDFYGVDYLSRIGLSVSDSLNNCWPMNLCREKGPQLTFALNYILMARFLFGSFENFIYEAEKPSAFSLSTPPIKAINQISLERYRSKWLELISQMPDSGRNALRTLDASPYTWLKRNDIEWLKEHLPEKNGLDPG